MPEAANNARNVSEPKIPGNKNAGSQGLDEFLSQSAPLPEPAPVLNPVINPRQQSLPDALQGTAFHHSVSLHLRGSLDEVTLVYALELLVSQQPALRLTLQARAVAASLDHAASEPTLVVQPSMPLPLECRDLSWLNAGDTAEEWKSILRHETVAPFDLFRGPLFRTLLVRMSPQKHILVFTTHPGIANAAAIKAMMTRLPKIYGVVKEGKIETRTADTGVANTGPASDPAVENLVAFEPGPERSDPDTLPGALLPADFPRSGAYTSANCSMHLDAPLRGNEDTNQDASLAVLAAYVLWLHRTTGQAELICGVGMDSGARLLPVRSLLLAQDNAATFSARLRANIEHVCEQGASSVKATGQPGWAHNQVHCEGEEKPIQFAGLEAELVWNTRNSGGAELAFYFRNSDGTLSLNCSYNERLFKRETVLRWAAEVERLLRSMLEQPEQTLSQTAWLSSEEHHRLVFDLNRTASRYPQSSSIQELFERQALDTPDAIALINEEGALTYTELNEKANQLARFLSRYEVRRGERIALLVERSLASVVGALAVLKLGCAYVPIDASEPGHAVQDVMKHCRPAAILTQARFVPVFHNLQSLHAAPIVLLDEDWAAVATEAVESLAFPIAAEAPACVLYRRDALGHLRGVVLPHRALVRQVRGWDGLNFDASEVFLQLARPAEDAWALEVWGPLLNGGRLAMSPPGWQAPVQIGSAIEHYRATTAWLNAADLERIVAGHIEALAPLRQIVMGGGPSSPSLIRRLLERYPELKLVSGFGPIENGSFTCVNHISLDSIPDAGLNLHVGRPMPNTRAYILDPSREVARFGVPGELHIAGDGLAIGYLHAPELTDRKFFMHTFSPLLRERLFRTGIRARYREDGRIEVLGALDVHMLTERFRAEAGPDPTHSVSSLDAGRPKHELEGLQALEIFFAD